MVRVFVSYSGRNEADKDFAARLLARVKEQALHPWIFEDRGSEVPLGASISDHCRKEIRKADLFVAVVSDSSLKSAATQDEVAFALNALEEDEILTLVTTATATSMWPEPYCLLAPQKHLPCGRMDDETIEVFVEDLCKAAGVGYAPPGDPVRRLPMIRRLTAEVRSARPVKPEYAAGNFTRVRERAQEIAQAYAEGRVSNAYSLLETLEVDLAKWYEPGNFYYPRLVLGVLLLDVEGTRRSDIDKAKGIFESILADPALLDKTDENVYAALAAAQFLLKDMASAVRLYLTAASIVRARGEVDGDIVHNLLMCRLVAGPAASLPAFDVQAWTPEPGSPVTTDDPYLRERIDVLLAACRAQQGDVGPLRLLLAKEHARQRQHADILLRVAQDLASNARIVNDPQSRAFVIEVHQLLLPDLAPASRLTCSLSLATLFYTAGEYVQALSQLRAAQRDASPHPRFHVEEYWCLMHLECFDEATEAVRRAADMRLHDSAQYAAPALREFQYFRGLAAWLLQRRDLAARDFQDSCYGASMAYERIAERHLPLPAKPEATRIKAFLRRWSS